jgi:quinol monooxygenase YgiN
MVRQLSNEKRAEALRAFWEGFKLTQLNVEFSRKMIGDAVEKTTKLVEETCKSPNAAMMINEAFAGPSALDTEKWLTSMGFADPFFSHMYPKTQTTVNSMTYDKVPGYTDKDFLSNGSVLYTDPCGKWIHEILEEDISVLYGDAGIEIEGHPFAKRTIIRRVVKYSYAEDPTLFVIVILINTHTPGGRYDEIVLRDVFFFKQEMFEAIIQMAEELKKKYPGATVFVAADTNSSENVKQAVLDFNRGRCVRGEIKDRSIKRPNDPVDPTKPSEISLTPENFDEFYTRFMLLPFAMMTAKGYKSSGDVPGGTSDHVPDFTIDYCWVDGLPPGFEMQTESMKTGKTGTGGSDHNGIVMTFKCTGTRIEPQVIVTVELLVKEKFLDEFLSEARALSKLSRSEPRCTGFHVTQSLKDSEQSESGEKAIWYSFVEIFESKAAFEHHKTTDHFKKWDAFRGSSPSPFQQIRVNKGLEIADNTPC